MLRVFFLIRALDRGGAERQLIALVRGLDKERFAPTVATFYDGGALRPELERMAGVTVVSLGKRGRWDVLPFLRRLDRAIGQARPDIIHGYMEMPNQLALLLGRRHGARVIWGLRGSAVDFVRYNWAVRWDFAACARLSRFPDLIIANSEVGRRDYLAQGYRAERLRVIANGIDTARFRPDPAAGLAQRERWGVAPDVPLIGVVARLDPQKDHPTFLRAAALLAGERPEARFVCVGEGPAEYLALLRRQAADLGLGDRLIWAGPCDDMVAAHNALDVATSSSAFGEGFSNTLGEAMACGIPCAATDSGDAAIVIGDTGRVVPTKDPAALAAAWRELLDLAPERREALRSAVRARIATRFSLRILVDATSAALIDVAEQRPVPPLRARLRGARGGRGQHGH